MWLFEMPHLSLPTPTTGIAGAALTEKLRSMGMASLLRQDLSFFNEAGNSASELTGFLAEKVDKVMVLTTEQLDLVAQIIGGVGSSLLIIFWLCYFDWSANIT